MKDKQSEKIGSKDDKKQESAVVMEEFASMEEIRMEKNLNSDSVSEKALDFQLIDSEEISVEVENELEGMEESSVMDEIRTEKSVNSGSVIDVSGKVLDFPLNDMDETSGSVIDVSGKVLDFPLIDMDETAVEEVYMYRNELNLIPRAFGKFTGLRTLKFFANEVNLFPVEFRHLVDLEHLQVKVTEPGLNGLELSKLKNLKELELTKVPPRPSAFPILSEIAGLKRLTKLSVCHFSIRYLPPEIGCLVNLEYLDLSFNKMKKLPEEITSLDLLTTLKVTNNKLIELPRLSRLQQLENLDLSYNRLTSIGCLELDTMHNLHNLNLQHNQLSWCQMPSWISCNFDGNRKDMSNDDSSEMDVYEGSFVEQSSPVHRISAKNVCVAARREKGWKRRYNLQAKPSKEMINRKKWKFDDTNQSSEKCMTCQVSGNDDNGSSEGLSLVADVELDSKKIFPEGDRKQNSVSGLHNEKSIAPDQSANECSCSVINSYGIQKEVKAADRSESGSIRETVSVAAEVPGEGSSSESSISVHKSKRHFEDDLDNPKPTKSRRPTSDPSFMSRQYSERSFCGAEEFLPDGFYDAGRDRPLMPLHSYEKNVDVNSREVILLDRQKDEHLDATLLRARSLVYNVKQMSSSISHDGNPVIDMLHVTSLLALFVSDHFGGSDKSAVTQKARKSVSGSNYKKPFACTCAPGISGDTNKTSNLEVESEEDIAFLDICEGFLRSIKERRNSVVVPIGGLQFGVCRHRALLMKYLCDRMEPRIPCELVRGYLDFSPHAWNIIVVKRGESLVRFLIDACHPYSIREESDPEYFCRYIPLSRMGASFLADHDCNPDHLFPSLSVCETIGKVASTSLMSCNVGSVETAVKVRKLEVNGASPHEIRNFELCCLAEVRMLSAFKHSCIVEYYGHQISSKWSLTTDGNVEGRTLQSAIAMEHIKGGSLKSYIDKLSDAGEKHVSADLALSIARDVAFALTELHSKHIIHRDVKSENILIDIEKKRQDGTPVVKICDFDRAIPLHSYLHTCCIAHVGISPPNICVGTPRWMAPEVFLTMHEQNLYGLEIDIWSFGCLLLELLTLQVPYFGVADSDIEKSLQMGERPKLTEELEALSHNEKELETESETLPFLAKLYRHCTEKSPADRPSAENIYNLLLDHSILSTDSRSSDEE